MYKIEKRYMNQDGGVRVKFVVMKIHEVEDERRQLEDVAELETYPQAEDYIMRLLTK